MNRADTLALQRRLIAAGFELVLDGRYGPRTADAYHRYINGLGPHDPEAAALDALPVPPAPKPWWRSTAIKGGLGQILIGIGALVGLSLDPSQIAQVLDVVSAMIGISHGHDAGGVITYAALALSLLSGLASLWGTAKRQAPIDTGLVLPGVRLGARELPLDIAEGVRPGAARSPSVERSPFDDPFVSGGD